MNTFRCCFPKLGQILLGYVQGSDSSEKLARKIGETKAGKERKEEGREEKKKMNVVNSH